MMDEIQAVFSYITDNEHIFRVLGAILIILFALIMRTLFAKIIIKILKRFTDKTKNKIDDHLLDIICPPLTFSFIIMGIMFAVITLDMPENADIFMNRITKSLIAYTILWAVYRASDKISMLLSKVTTKTETKIDDMLLPLLQKSIKVIVISLGVIVIADQWDYNIAGILAGLGLGGLAFALAAKDTASNLFAGITIMLDKPFKIGDWIATSAVEGTVEEMGFRSTKVRTFENALVFVPNSLVSNDAIINWSKRGKRRITYKLGLTYATKSEEINECVSKITAMLKNNSDIHPETIFVYFEGFGDSSLNIFVYFFTKTTVWQEFLEVRHDVNLRIMNIVEELGLSIAFPSQSIYIEKK